jgi:hypothetical protein
MLKLNRAHCAETTAIHAVKWNESQGAFTHSKNVNSDWIQVPLVEPFAIDVWMARHGFEVWTDNKRTEHLAPVSSDMPAKPSEGKPIPIYSVPVYSKEIGGQGGMLIVKGKVATDALCDLFDLIGNDLTDEHPQIPVVHVQTEDSDFGVKPTFSLTDIVARPVIWARPIVTFG